MSDGWTKTAKQHEATRLVAAHPYTLLYGGSRSGKSALGVYLTIVRACKQPCSRHSIARQIFRDAVTKLGLDTIPVVFSTAFPHLDYSLDRSKWYWTLPNGSEIWLNGLDDAGDRDARILGAEYSTMMYDEVDQMAYPSILLARTRLAQRNDLVKREIFCCNPPSTSSWVHRLFIEACDPIDRKPLVDPDAYASILMNPQDNLAHIDPGYLARLATLPKAQRDRFLHGLWGNDSQTVLWQRDWFHRIAQAPEGLEMVVVGVDPAGSSRPGADDTGITAAGTKDRRYTVLESQGVVATPEQWAQRVVDCYRRWGASYVVAEANYGGEMVKSTIHAVEPAIRVELVHASRGKAVRAEPISALYEQGLVDHVGDLGDLEDELLLYDMANPPKISPGRGDSCIWALTKLSGGGVIRPQISTYQQDSEGESEKKIADMSTAELLVTEELWDEL